MSWALDRSHQRNPQRRNDARATLGVTDVHAALVGKIVGNIGFVDLPAGRKHERAGLQRVRAHRGVAPECLMPRVPFFQLWSGMQRERARKYRDMDLLAEPDHRCPHQGHQVLAADQAAETPDVGIEYNEIGGIALAPEHSLGEGRHGLAMPAHQPAVAVEEQQGIVDGGHLRTRIDLVTPHHDVGSGFSCGGTQPLGIFAGGDDGGIPEPDATSSPLLERAVPAFRPVGVAGEPYFREDDQVGAAFGGFCDQLFGADQRSLAVHEGRRLLHNGDAYDFASAQNRLARFLHHCVCPLFEWMPVWAMMIAVACTCGTPAGTGGPTLRRERVSWILCRLTC